MIGDSGLPLGANLVAFALPERVLGLPADGEIVADPEVALAVEHRLATRAIPAAVELEGEYPCARREVQVRHEWNRPHRLALRNRIELVDQRKESLGLVPRITDDRFRRRERIGRRASFRRRRGREEFIARIRGHPCHASGEHVGQRGEVRHRRRLAAVERILDGGAPAAALNIDKAGYVSRSDLEAEWWPLIAVP